jgi:uncharacterized protein YggE
MRASRNAPFFAIGIVIAVVAAVLVAAAFRFIPAAAGSAPAATVASAGGPRDTVTVIGEGTQHAAPDTAIINLGVNAKRGSARDALNVASSEIARLVNAIKAKGVTDADIQTTSLSINQNYDCCGNVTSYTASNQVTVRIHHIANVAVIISAAADSVGNDVQLGGITLLLSDNVSQLKGARQSAMSAAADKAKQWAALSGRHLGKVLSVSEVVGSTVPQPQCTGGCGGGGGIQGGQVDVVVDVTVVYELTD